MSYTTNIHSHRQDFVNKVEKLIPNLNNKTKYVLHHKNLKQYLDLGMKLKKIHRGISFTEETWLKCYTDLNTEVRIKACNDFEKDSFHINEQQRIRQNNGKHTPLH